MDMYFVYVYAGWEGSAADGRVYLNARMSDFSVPASKWYLADAWFPSCNTLLVPYHNQRYHLREWMQGSQKYVPLVVSPGDAY